MPDSSCGSIEGPMFLMNEVMPYMVRYRLSTVITDRSCIRVTHLLLRHVYDPASRKELVAVVRVEAWERLVLRRAYRRYYPRSC